MEMFCFIILILFSTGECFNIVTLTPSEAVVFENRSVTLNCSYNANETYNYSKWFTSSLPGENFYISKKNGCQCDTHGFWNECKSECEENQFLLTLNVTRAQNSENWTCVIGGRESNVALLYVVVPISFVNITYPVQRNVTVLENSVIKFKCNTSFGRPRANITWYQQLGPNTDRITTNTSHFYTESETGLIMTESTLNLVPSRETHGSFIYCAGTNTNNSAVFSTLVHLNIQYPPDDGPKIEHQGNGTVYTVIEHSQGNLSCVISGGNPRPVLIWSCYNSGDEYGEGDQIVRQITWTAARGTDRNCTCNYSHVIPGNQFAFVMVQVLFAPTVPIFYIDSKSVSGTINVVQGKFVTILCKSSSMPEALYHWKRFGIVSADTETLTLSHIEIEDNGEYTCEANNLMEASSGKIVTGKAKASVEINVQYPPRTGAIADKSVVEGLSLIIKCPYIPGNPVHTVFKWTREIDAWEWNEPELEISKVSRTDDMQYTCTTTNKMQPTYGPVIYGNSSISFHLNVMYRSSVDSFFVTGFDAQHIITLDEETDVTFNCIVDSNPKSNISLSFESKSIEFFSSTKHLTHILRDVTCRESGIYTCTGQNEYNEGQPSTRNVTLLVRCRPKVFGVVNEYVSSNLSASATLSLTVLAYPFSQTNGYQWRKLDGLAWEPVRNSSSVAINTVTIQTDKMFLTVIQINLTVISVKETHSGIYSILVENSMGNLTQNFTLNVEGKELEVVKGAVALIAGTVGAVAACFGITTGIFVVLRRFKLFSRIQKKLGDAVTDPDETQTYDNLQHAHYENTTVVYDSLETKHEEQTATETYEMSNTETNEHTYTNIQKTSKDSKLYVNLEMKQ